MKGWAWQAMLHWWVHTSNGTQNRNRRMRNRMYGGVRGRKTKVGEKLLRFPPTRFFSSPFSSIFSLKPWKLRGKIVSLHKKSCTWQIESKLSLRSFAFSLQKKSCTRQIESKLSLRSFAFSLPPNSLKKIFRLCKTWVKDNESVWSIFAYSVVCTSEAALGDNYY